MGYIQNRCFLSNEGSFIATNNVVTSYNTQTCSGSVNTTTTDYQCTNDGLFGGKINSYYKYSVITYPIFKQWITLLYYTQPNCKGYVIQYIIQTNPTGFPTGCNSYNPTDNSMIASAFITYSTDYPGYPKLANAESYLIEK